MEGSLIEVAKGIGRLFLHPLFYWSFILVLLSGIRRIRQERMDFARKFILCFPSGKGNIFYSLLFGFIISVITLSAGFVFTVETLIALSIVMFVLSISFNFAALSPVYSIGITFAVLFLLPQFLRDTSIIDERWFTDVNFPGLAILLGLLIIAEALFLKLIKRHHFFPSLVRSERGGWIGQSRIKQFWHDSHLFAYPWRKSAADGAVLALCYYRRGNLRFTVISVPPRNSIGGTGKQSPCYCAAHVGLADGNRSYCNIGIN